MDVASALGDADAILSRAKAVVKQQSSSVSSVAHRLYENENEDISSGSSTATRSASWEQHKGAPHQSTSYSAVEPGRQTTLQQGEVTCDDDCAQGNQQQGKKLTIDDLAATNVRARQGLIATLELGQDAAQIPGDACRSDYLGEYESLVNQLLGTGMDPAAVLAARTTTRESSGESAFMDKGENGGLPQGNKLQRQCDVLESLVMERELRLRSYLHSVERRSRVNNISREQALVGRRQMESQLRDERIDSARRLVELERDRGVQAARQEEELRVLRESLREVDRARAASAVDEKDDDGEREERIHDDGNSDDDVSGLRGLDIREKTVIVSAVVDTMEKLRGRLVRCTVQALGELVRMASEVHKARDRNKLFKEAHLELKTVLVRHFGDRKCRCGQRFKFAHMPQLWPLREGDLEGLAPFEHSNMINALRRLMVAFDNSSVEQRMAVGSFRTYLEILRNRDWIFAIAQLPIICNNTKNTLLPPRGNNNA